MKTMGLALLLAGLVGLEAAAAGDPNAMARGALENSRLRFLNVKKGHVAFMGGSITEMDGYRPMVMEMLKTRFPETAFTFTDAGVASTCSTTGAFRLKDDVLDKGPVDLFFVEFAVNDDQDAHHPREACIRGMEGIVRHLRRHNPRADIVLVYFVNENMAALYRRGAVPLPIAAHEEVAAHYQLSSVNVAKEVAARIEAGELTWEKYGGVHPAPLGNRLAADRVGALLDDCWKEPPAAGAAAKDCPMPTRPLDEMSYAGGRFLDLRKAKLSSDWQIHVPNWASLPGGKRDRFNRLPILEATKPGASLTLEFSGTAIGAYILAGPDAGTVEVSLDGGPARTIELWHLFSAGLHYPRTVLFGDGLAPGKHTLALKLCPEKNARSTGTAMRAMHFVVNEVPAARAVRAG